MGSDRRLGTHHAVCGCSVAGAVLQGPHPPSERHSLPRLGSTSIRDAEELPLWKDTGVAQRRRLCGSPKRDLRIVSLAAAFFLAACSSHIGTSTLTERGSRLHSPESLCSGKVLLKPPTSTEHPRVHPPRITKSEVPVNFVGPPPVPDIVYARITITDFGEATATGLDLAFDNSPEWVVIYRNAKIMPIGGPIGAEPRPVAHETILSVFDPTSGSGLDLQGCSSGP